MIINLKLTHIHLLGILLFVIIGANFGYAVYEGVENLVDSAEDRTVGTLSTQAQKDTVIKHYANSNENSADYLKCKKHLMTYMLNNPSCRKTIAEEASKPNKQQKPKINSERVAQNSIEEQIRKLKKPTPEDLYILKSKIVPPVCPKCPEYSNPCSLCNKKPGQKRAEEESVGADLAKGKGPVNSPAALAANKQKEKRGTPGTGGIGGGQVNGGTAPGGSGSQNHQAPIPRLNSFADFA